MPTSPLRLAYSQRVWFSTNSGSTPGTLLPPRCCQSIHQKSTPVRSKLSSTTFSQALSSFSLPASKSTGMPLEGSMPISRAMAG